RHGIYCSSVLCAKLSQRTGSTPPAPAQRSRHRLLALIMPADSSLSVALISKKYPRERRQHRENTPSLWKNLPLLSKCQNRLKTQRGRDLAKERRENKGAIPLVEYGFLSRLLCVSRTSFLTEEKMLSIGLHPRMVGQAGRTFSTLSTCS